MRILVVEDMGIAADMAHAELVQAMPCEPVVVADPVAAVDRLRGEQFGAVVADMLFLAHSDEFERRRRNGQVRLTDARLHLSGLAVLQAAGIVQTPTVLWTSGEPNRRLHLIFAHEQFGCRAMCTKEAKGTLAAAVKAIASGRDYIDPLLQMHLPTKSTPTLRETFFAAESRRAMWRAMALGLHDHAQIGRAVGIAAGRVRRNVDEMRSKLVAFDPGCSDQGPPTAELVRYASQNWEFFLDDTVRKVYP